MSASLHKMVGMTFRVSSLLLCCLMPLAGCGAGSLLSSAGAVPNLSGNWQIQSAAGTTGGALPTAGLLLLGSLTSQGSNVSGTFRLSNLALPNGCTLNQVVTVSGSVDSNRSLNLTSASFGGSILTVQLAIPPVLTSFGTGTIAVSGSTCTYPSAPAIGVQVAPVTGTYSGTLTAANTVSTAPIQTGTGTLLLTQNAIPQSDGEYPLTGTLQFNGGGCNNTVAVAGTASGVGITLATAPASQFVLSQDTMTGAVNPTATQILNSYVLYALGPCNAGVTSFSSYTGSFTRQ